MSTTSWNILRRGPLHPCHWDSQCSSVISGVDSVAQNTPCRTENTLPHTYTQTLTLSLSHTHTHTHTRTHAHTHAHTHMHTKTHVHQYCSVPFSSVDFPVDKSVHSTVAPSPKHSHTHTDLYCL